MKFRKHMDLCDIIYKSFVQFIVDSYSKFFRFLSHSFMDALMKLWNNALFSVFIIWVKYEAQTILACEYFRHAHLKKSKSNESETKQDFLRWLSLNGYITVA